MSDYLRGLYHANDPHVDPLKPSGLQTIRLTSPKSFVAGSSQAAGDFVHSTGQALGRLPQLGDWLANRSTSWASTVGAVKFDKNYRDAINGQSANQKDFSPLVAYNTLKDIEALNKTTQELLMKGKQ